MSWFWPILAVALIVGGMVWFVPSAVHWPGGGIWVFVGVLMQAVGFVVLVLWLRQRVTFK